MAHISRLETELYDYQYNLGLLLMEQKEWDTETEKLKARAEDAEEKLRRELASNLLFVAEAEKHEESLKKALAMERLCVHDLEKALGAEPAEIKLLAENKLKEAEDLISENSIKALQAESKLHALDALQVEPSHKQGIAERNLQEGESNMKDDSVTKVGAAAGGVVDTESKGRSSRNRGTERYREAVLGCSRWIGRSEM